MLEQIAQVEEDRARASAEAAEQHAEQAAIDMQYLSLAEHQNDTDRLPDTQTREERLREIDRELEEKKRRRMEEAARRQREAEENRRERRLMRERHPHHHLGSGVR